MLRHAMVGVGCLLVLIGILSFLVPAVPAWGTLVLLIAGAFSTAAGAWIL